MANYKSYVIPEPNEALRCVEKNLEEAISNIPKKGSVVKIHCAGVCHTDLHYFEGGYSLSDTEVFEFKSRPSYCYPKVPGHEVSGEVYALGEAVPVDCGIAVGDKVCVYPWMGCEDCIACEEGENGHCSIGGKELGFCIDGGYAQFAVVPHYRNLFPLPSNVSMELGSTLGCGCLTAYNACKTVVDSFSELMVFRCSSQLKIAVVGLGGVGQWALELLPMLLPQDQRNKLQITGFDIDPNRLEKFAKNGSIAGQIVLERSKPADVLVRETVERLAGSTFHAVMDFVNNSTTFKLGNRILGKYGVLVAVGLFGGSGEVRLPPLAIMRQRIIGIQTGNRKSMQNLLKFLGDIEVPVKGPAIQVYQLSDCMQALKDLRDRKAEGRIILKCN